MSRTLRYRPALYGSDRPAQRERGPRAVRSLGCWVWATGERSLLDPQVGLDDLDCDRGRGVGAEAAALDDDADRYLRVAGGREAGEDRVVGGGVGQAVLGRPGLARDHEGA